MVILTPLEGGGRVDSLAGALLLSDMAMVWTVSVWGCLKRPELGLGEAQNRRCVNETTGQRIVDGLQTLTPHT
jgi:hypothetical protein